MKSWFGASMTCCQWVHLKNALTVVRLNKSPMKLS